MVWSKYEKFQNPTFLAAQKSRPNGLLLRMLWWMENIIPHFLLLTLWDHTKKTSTFYTPNCERDDKSNQKARRWSLGPTLLSAKWQKHMKLRYGVIQNSILTKFQGFRVSKLRVLLKDLKGFKRFILTVLWTFYQAVPCGRLKLSKNWSLKINVVWNEWFTVVCYDTLNMLYQCCGICHHCGNKTYVTIYY